MKQLLAQLLTLLATLVAIAAAGAGALWSVRAPGIWREIPYDAIQNSLRHSFARMVAEGSGSLSDTQEALGHKHAATTRVYVQRIAVKRDKFGKEIAKRLKT